MLTLSSSLPEACAPAFPDSLRSFVLSPVLFRRALTGAHATDAGRDSPLAPYLALHPVGFTVPPLSPAPRCAFTAPFHPYRPRMPDEPIATGGLFLWHYPAPCAPGGTRDVGRYCRYAQDGWPLATTVPCGVRTFLPAQDKPAPSDRLTVPFLIIPEKETTKKSE